VSYYVNCHGIGPHELASLYLVHHCLAMVWWGVSAGCEEAGCGRC
jgi:hypothetical protein